MLWPQLKAHFPFSQPLHRNLSIQAKASIHWDNHPQIFRLFSADDLQSAEHIPSQLTTAYKPIVESLTYDLNLSCQLISKINTIIMFQRKRPLLQFYASGGELLRSPSHTGKAKTHGNSIIY